MGVGGGEGREGGGKEREQLVGITFLLPGTLTQGLVAVSLPGNHLDGPSCDTADSVANREPRGLPACFILQELHLYGRDDSHTPLQLSPQGFSESLNSGFCILDPGLTTHVLASRGQNDKTDAGRMDDESGHSKRALWFPGSSSLQATALAVSPGVCICR